MTNHEFGSSGSIAGFFTNIAIGLVLCLTVVAIHVITTADLALSVKIFGTLIAVAFGAYHAIKLYLVKMDETASMAE